MEKGERRKVLLAGATGLVGGEILRLLKSDHDALDVQALVRHPLGLNANVREHLTDFTDLEDRADWFKVDVVFSALGTTIAKAGSQAAFRRVDLEYPLAIAKLARAQGARHFLFVSALGADARSFFFYNRVKGELEEAIRALGYPSVTIARPSMLLGERKEYRFAEELGKKFIRLMPEAWAGVQASQVAAGLVKAAREDKPGVRILDNRELRRN